MSSNNTTMQQLQAAFSAIAGKMTPEQLNKLARVSVENASKMNPRTARKLLKDVQIDMKTVQKEMSKLVKKNTLPTHTPGQNKPCLCGSGKKYKKCCFGKTALTKTEVNNNNNTESEVKTKTECADICLN